MSYQAAVNTIRDIAKEVNPKGTFTHGRRNDASLEFAEVMPQIHLLPFTSDVNIDNGYIDSYSMQMLFLQQDSPESSVTEREAIIAEMDTLCRSFVTTLNNTDGVSISRVRTEPNYRIFSATTSGYLLSFTLQISSSVC